MKSQPVSGFPNLQEHTVLFHYSLHIITHRDCDLVHVTFVMVRSAYNETGDTRTCTVLIVFPGWESGSEVSKIPIIRLQPE